MNILPIPGQKKGLYSPWSVLPTMGPRCSFSLSQENVEGLAEARSILSERLFQAQESLSFPKLLHS